MVIFFIENPLYPKRFLKKLKCCSHVKKKSSPIVIKQLTELEFFHS